MAGTEEVSDSTPIIGIGAATVWKNGVAQQVGGENTLARSIFVSDGDVYMAGSEYFLDTGTSFAVVWKNGVPQRLGSSNGVYTSDFLGAHSVFVYGGDVYAAGRTWDTLYSGSFFNAMFWKNGELQPLSDVNRIDSEARSVYVSDGNVYVAGFEENEPGMIYATFWKNGVSQRLSRLSDGSTYAQANSVFVSGDDVYAAGFEEYDNHWGFNIPILWKNGVAQRLSSDYTSEARSVFVSGGDVYVVGYELHVEGDEGNLKAINRAKIWKNGVEQFLSDVSDNYTDAYSVFVSGNDVYVAGQEITDPSTMSGRYATLWINGHKVTLNRDKKSYGHASSLFVVK